MSCSSQLIMCSVINHPIGHKLAHTYNCTEWCVEESAGGLF